MVISIYAVLLLIALGLTISNAATRGRPNLWVPLLLVIIADMLRLWVVRIVQ